MLPWHSVLCPGIRATIVPHGCPLSQISEHLDYRPLTRGADIRKTITLRQLPQVTFSETGNQQIDLANQ